MADLQRLTNYQVSDQESNMEIRTNRLDPIVSSATRYTFRLDTSSYIDRNSMLVFKLHTTAAASGNCRVNCLSGALAAIKSVELQIGDFQVQKIDNVNKWATLNHVLSRSPQVQNKKLSHYLHNALDVIVQRAAGATNPELVGALRPSNTTSGINYGAPTTGGGAAINSQALDQNASANQQVGIPLGMLLPVLEGRDLPTFLFTNYKVHLTIEFESDSGVFANDITQNGYGAGQALRAAAGTVLFSDVELLVDELILPARVQNAVLEETVKEGGYQITYIGVDNIKKTINAGTANTEQSIEHRLNLSNQELHYVQFLKSLPDETNDKVVCGMGCDAISLQEVQFNVNGVDIYPAGFVENPIEFYNNVSYNLGRDLQVVKPFYVKDPATCASLLSPPQMGLLGKYSPICLDLKNGEPAIRGGGRFIGEYPIRVLYKRKPVAETTSTWFNGGAGNNVIICNNETGTLNCDYFVGLTRIVNVKTLPNGSQNVVVSNM